MRLRAAWKTMQNNHPLDWDGLLWVHHFPYEPPVILSHPDGSTFVFQHAFYRKENGKTVVYSEHCGYHAFLIDPVTGTNYSDLKHPDEIKHAK